VRTTLWQQRKSLRVRLTVLLASMLLVACAAVGVATTLALRSYLIHRFDQQLALAGGRYAGALEADDHDDDNVETSTIGQAIGTLGARVIDELVAHQSHRVTAVRQRAGGKGLNVASVLTRMSEVTQSEPM